MYFLGVWYIAELPCTQGPAYVSHFSSNARGLGTLKFPSERLELAKILQGRVYNPGRIHATVMPVLNESFSTTLHCLASPYPQQKDSDEWRKILCNASKIFFWHVCAPGSHNFFDYLVDDGLCEKGHINRKIYFSQNKAHHPCSSLVISRTIALLLCRFCVEKPWETGRQFCRR